MGTRDTREQLAWQAVRHRYIPELGRATGLIQELFYCKLTRARAEKAHAKTPSVPVVRADKEPPVTTQGGAESLDGQLPWQTPELCA